ncbi:MAG: ComF family protein [Thermomicrobiales bacterium]|nr:ComF family protein [Thermomicrobiales bacterium]
MTGRGLATLGTYVLDVVYPRRCAGCGKRGTWLCPQCEAGDACFSGALCAPCGVPVARGACQCHELPASIERVRSVGAYDGWLRGAVVQMKYHGEWARAGHLAPLLAQAAADMLPVDVLVPVPLHPARQKQRGFNQTEKLAAALAGETGLPVKRVLERTRRTAPQVGLDAAGRAANVRGAFGMVAGASVAGQTVLLVDDVITTGSTLGACAEVLVVAGATTVCVVTVARELA